MYNLINYSKLLQKNVIVILENKLSNFKLSFNTSIFKKI
jgi:hypothetical protein